MYTVMAPYYVFVCSACAGIHRELNNKVKGISMSVYTDAELKSLAENGNKVSQLYTKVWYTNPSPYKESTRKANGNVEPKKRPRT
jgi:hypothetical protein